LIRQAEASPGHVDTEYRHMVMPPRLYKFSLNMYLLNEVRDLHDEDVLIEEVKTILDDLVNEGVRSRRYHFPGTFQATDLIKGGNPGGVIIGAGDTIIELGHPVTASVCLGMITEREDLVADGRATVVGKELQELPEGRYSFALIVLTEVTEANESCRHALARKMSSCDSMAGCMARVLSDRIWVRLSKEALNRGISLGTIGWHLISELKKEKDRFNKVEVIYVVSEKDHVNRLRPIADKLAEIKTARYKTKYIKREDCNSILDCEECPEFLTCQVFKDAVVIARERSKGE
jgi:CO dehydrogenase/acetyl-CoA synthase beta subunit